MKMKKLLAAALAATMVLSSMVSSFVASAADPAIGAENVTVCPSDTEATVTVDFTIPFGADGVTAPHLTLNLDLEGYTLTDVTTSDENVTEIGVNSATGNVIIETDTYVDNTLTDISATAKFTAVAGKNVANTYTLTIDVLETADYDEEDIVISSTTATVTVGHTEVDDDAVDATCTTDGLTAGKHCSACNAVIVPQEVITAKGHTPAEAVAENDNPATCGVAGSYDSVVKCSVCTAELNRETITVPPTGNHTPAAPVVENNVDATCGVDGSYESVVKCSVCTAEISRETVSVPATGAHAYVYTDTLDGEHHTVACENCDTEFDGEAHDFSAGDCKCGAVEEVDVVIEMENTSKSLLFEGIVHIKTYFAYANASANGFDKEYILENAGVLFWKEADYPGEDAATIGTESHGEKVQYSGLYQGKVEYTAISSGIATKEYGDNVYFRPYFIVNGEYQYGDVVSYGVKSYCEGRFEKSSNTYLKKALVAMLNYGAQAQIYFQYKTDKLANRDIDTYLNKGWINSQIIAEPSTWNADYLNPAKTADEAMTVNFVNTGTFEKPSNSLLLEGAILFKTFIDVADHSIATKSISKTMYYWSEEDYNKLLAAGTPLSKDNATKAVEGTDWANYKTFKECWTESEQIVTKAYGDTVYMAFCVTTNDSEYCTGVFSYNPETYAYNKLNDSNDTTGLMGLKQDIDSLSRAMVLFGEYAKIYLNNK